MKTAIYLDGLNLCGSLKGASLKWLDTRHWLRTIWKPRHQILHVKYFSANYQPYQMIHKGLIVKRYIYAP